MKFSQIYFDEISSNLDKLRYSRVRKISAVPKSLYSDHEGEENSYWDLSIPKDYERNAGILICYLIVYSREKPYWYSSFTDHLGQLCKKYQYKGKWMLLHKLLKVQSHKLILYEICTRIPAHEFFGNYYKEIEKVTLRPLIAFVKKQKPKAKSQARVRGYRDHGSRRLPHEIHSASSVSGPNPTKLNFENSYKKRLALINFLYG